MKDDVSIIEFNDQNTSNPDIRMQSISNKVHQGSYDSSLKRNSSPIKYKENFNAKKFKVGTVTFQVSYIYVLIKWSESLFCILYK